MANAFQKFAAAGTTAAIAVAAVAPAASASEFHNFKDVSSNYDEAVTFFYLADIIKGKSDTEFGTNLNLTRGDAAVIMANALDLDTKNAPDAGFTDLIPRIEGAVNALAAEGIISGKDKKTFAPNEPLSRGAMAKILVLGFGLEDFAADTPFTDAVGVFGPYIEAIYGAEITNGKTKDSFGTNLKITRGEFVNLLYKTYEAVFENMYMPLAEEVTVINSTSFTIALDEAAPEDYTAKDVYGLFYVDVELAGDFVMELKPSKLSLSADRKTLTVEHNDLAGKQGWLYVDDVETAFDFAPPSAGKGSVTLEGVTAPVAFDFNGGTAASVVLPASNGNANLNAMEMTVVDSISATQVEVTLKSTDVEAAKAGEGANWGTLTLTDGKWKLIDHPKYDVIPAGNYVLEAPFTDQSNNTTTLTLNVKVQ
ncbi:S-layer homology domain-containing protein [Bacillus infantis]|uniref:S-layer homology domain-containing protein n=1 Tax=Bacillus infantis TaxID=324767 RepID=UPI003CF02678